jgi:hypothetical protein
MAAAMPMSISTCDGQGLDRRATGASLHPWHYEASATEPANPLASAVVHNAEEARAAVDQVCHGADWIKLFPAGAYSFPPMARRSMC